MVNSVMIKKRNVFKHKAKVILLAISFIATFSLSPSVSSLSKDINPVSLVDTKWLAQHFNDSDLVIIDASPSKEYITKHIKNAVSASFSAEDYLSYGIDTSYGGTDLISDPDSSMPWTDGPPEYIQKVMQSLGINNDSTVVIYDRGAFFHATRFFWTLTYHGHKKAFILNGGLTKWIADGFPTVQEIPKTKKGNFVTSITDHSAVVSTDYVLTKLFKTNTVVVDANLSTWHYRSILAYSKSGHIPGSINAPYPTYFQNDKTWKPADELKRMFASLGIVPEKEIIAYCGGNPAGSALYFTLRHVLGYPNVKFYTESMIGWLKNPIDLPLHTYQNEHLIRDPLWVNWWAGKRIQYLVQDPKVLVVDVRPNEKYNAGHIPYAVNIPVKDLMNANISLKEWQKLLGDKGIGADTEVVLYDDHNNILSSLMFWLLEYFGHKKVSILNGGLTTWTGTGLEVTTTNTIIAQPKTKYDVAIRPKLYKIAPQQDKRLITEKENPDFFGYPRIWIVSSSKKRTISSPVPGLDYKHIPWEENLNETGLPKAAGQLILAYERLGITKQAEIVCFSESIEEATFTYYILRTLGYPRVRVYFPQDGGLIPAKTGFLRCPERESICHLRFMLTSLSTSREIHLKFFKNFM